MKPEAWYDADGNFTPHPEADALMEFAQENDLARLRAHAGLAQPDAGLVLPGRRGRRRSRRARPTSRSSRDRLRDAHLRRRRVPQRHVRRVRQRHQPARRVRRRQRGRLRQRRVRRRPAPQRVVPDPRRGVHRPRVPVRGRGVQRRVTPPRAPTVRSRCSSTTTTPSRAASRRATTRSSSGCSRAACRSTASATSSTSASSMPVVGARRGARSRSRTCRSMQAVTELDVTTGTPVTQAKLIEQGYYYRDAFRVFRAHAEDLFSVTVWGLTDGRSWRSELRRAARLRRRLQAKPAYYGVVDGELPARLRTANVFAGDVPLDAGATDASRGGSCRCTPIERRGRVPAALGGRPPDGVRRRSTTRRRTATDGVEFALDGADVHGRPRRHRRRRRPWSTERDGGYDVVVHLPLDRRGRGRHGRASTCGSPTAATTVGVEHAGRDGHADARRAAVVPRGRRGARRRPTIDGDGRRRLGRRQRGHAPTSRSTGTGGATAHGPHAVAGQHAVRARRGHRPGRRRLGLRPVDPGLGRDLRRRRATPRTARTATTTRRSGSAPTTWCRSAPATRRSSRTACRARRASIDGGLRRRGGDQPARVRRRSAPSTAWTSRSTTRPAARARRSATGPTRPAPATRPPPAGASAQLVEAAAPTAPVNVAPPVDPGHADRRREAQRRRPASGTPAGL